MPNYSALIQQAQESAKKLFGGFGEQKTTETRGYEPSYGPAQTGLQESLIGRYQEALGQGPGLGFESTGLEQQQALMRKEGIERLQSTAFQGGVGRGGLAQAKEALYTGQFDPRAAANLGQQRLNFIGMMQPAIQQAAFGGRGPQLSRVESSTIGGFPGGGGGGGASVSYPGRQERPYQSGIFRGDTFYPGETKADLGTSYYGPTTSKTLV